MYSKYGKTSCMILWGENLCRGFQVKGRSFAMNSWVSLFVGGLAGTAVMSVFLLLPRWMGWGKIDVIRAAGALVIGMREGAFLLGFSIHSLMGISFAFIYSALLGLSHLPLNGLTGLLLGSLHGVVVMLLVSIVIMEHHPVARYHDRGPVTGLAQLVAHMLYGLTVGIVAGSMN